MKIIYRIITLVALCAALPTALLGQYFDLGSSPSSIRWNHIRSGGNKYVFAEDNLSQASRLMTYIDTIRPHIGYGFRHGPMKLPIVMQPQNFASNGLVMLAPKRMELITTPNIDAFSEPWLKQLATHEYRHAVQFNNLNRGVIKGLSYILGQQGSLIGGIFLPLWLMEGDATMAETQFSSYGRGLQPSFSIEYRAMIDEIANARNSQIDKWFCGSYKYFVPDHYKIGYQIATYSYTRYKENIWNTVARYSTTYPYLIFTSKISLTKYYDTWVNKLFRDTFRDLANYWGSLPKQANSATIVPTPITSYTTYSGIMPINDSTVLAIKSDLDRTDRFVEIDLRTAAERTLFHTGKISTPPTCSPDGRVFWSEYRTSTSWSQRVNSQLCYFDYGKSTNPRTVRTERKSLFPTPLSDGRVAIVDYDYNGQYSIAILDKNMSPERTLCTLADTVSVHGLTYDDTTNALYYIGLSDAGMWIGTVSERDDSLDNSLNNPDNPDNPDGLSTVKYVKQPAYITLGRLKAKSGKLYYNSIESGLDEVHMFDIGSGKEYQISRSTYGSFDAAPMPSGDIVAMTTYDAQGYKLSTQKIVADSLREVVQTRLPQNTINPQRIKWGVPNIDSVVAKTTTTLPVKKYRKGLNLINIHSWAPIAFDPEGVVGERSLNLNIGATLISQNLLNSAFANFSYAWTDHGSSFRGGFTYAGFMPKIEINAEYGVGGQLIGIHDSFLGEVRLPRTENYFDISTRVYVPLILNAGYNFRILQPSVSLSHNNALMYNPLNNTFEHSLQKMTMMLQYSEYVRMSQRDIQPRFGYALRASATINPFSNTYGNLWSFYAQGYLPGVAPHHGIKLRAAYQWQDIQPGMNGFRQKEIFPRGGIYDITTTRYGASSVDYQLPLWCPDMGITSVLYFKRIRANLCFDFARYERLNRRVHNLYSYGGELIFDVNVLRTPSLATSTFSISAFKASDRNGVVVGVNLSIPL